MAPPVKTLWQKFPALHGSLMVDTVFGKVRVRKWPEKRGPNVPEQVRIQNERFSEAQRLSKTAKGIVMNRFMDATRKSGLYPRDLFTKMALNSPIEIELSDGRVIRAGRPRIENVEFQGFMLTRESNFNTLGNTLSNIEWQVPILDTAAFWDVSSPTIITIPEGAQIMQFWGGMRFTNTSEIGGSLNIRRLTPSILSPALNYIRVQEGMTYTTGPVVVEPGETYELAYVTTTSKTCIPLGTYFSGHIMAAQV